MPAQSQIDQIESEIVNALASGLLPRFPVPTQPSEAITLWQAFVREITGSHEAFMNRFAQRIQSTSGGNVLLQRDDNPPYRFRGMEGLYLKLAYRSGGTLLQFFVGDYSPIFRGFNR